jgi:NAD-dependent dihydropyrimidine dehydrogenase PreA subunit
MKHKYLKNVINLKFNEERCIGCGYCTLVCPHEVFGIMGKKAYINDKESCMECGACAKNCPVSAIEVKSGVG